MKPHTRGSRENLAVIQAFGRSAKTLTHPYRTSFGWGRNETAPRYSRFLWVDGEPAKLSARARSLCEDPSNEILVSVVSIWEMQLKSMLGKLALRAPLRNVIQDWTADGSLKLIELSANHVFRVES